MPEMFGPVNAICTGAPALPANWLYRAIEAKSTSTEPVIGWKSLTSCSAFVEEPACHRAASFGQPPLRLNLRTTPSEAGEASDHSPEATVSPLPCFTVAWWNPYRPGAV